MPVVGESENRLSVNDYGGGEELERDEPREGFTCAGIEMSADGNALAAGPLITSPTGVEAGAVAKDI